MGRKVAGVVAKVKTKKQDYIMAEFRVAITSTCIHKEPIFYYKA